MTLQEREAHACAIIDSMAEELRDVSLYLHDNPELGLDEYKAVKVINQFLETHNLHLKWVSLIFQSYKRRYGVTITVLHSIK